MRAAASTLLALAVLASPADAAQLDVRNCAGLTAALQAFEYNDIVRAVPFSTLTLVPRTSGLLACRGVVCYVRIQVGNATSAVPFASDDLCLTTVAQDGVMVIRTDRACAC